jgi:hypothetical protein
MVFNATFNNISVISWWLVLLAEIPGVLFCTTFENADWLVYRCAPNSNNSAPSIGYRYSRKTFLSVPFCYAHPTLVLNIIRQAHTKFGPECANVFRHRLCQHLQFRRSPIWFSSHCHWCFHFKSNILADDGDMLVLRMCIGNETTFVLNYFINQ